MAYRLPPVRTTRVFVKPVARRARVRCELLAWRMEVGVDGGYARNAYFSVQPSFAYESVIVPAYESGEPVQMGMEFANGTRVLLTGSVSLQMPELVGGSALQRFRMEVSGMERSQRP